MEVGGWQHAPAALLPGMTWCPWHTRLVGPKSRTGRVRKMSPPPGFDLPTVQPVQSRSTDWAIPAHTCREYLHKTIKFKPISTYWYLKWNVFYHTQQLTIYDSQYWRQNKGRSVNSFCGFWKNTGIWNYSLVLFMDQFCSRTFLIYLFLRFAGVSYGRFMVVRFGFNLSMYIRDRWC